jgi:hypothetical protein
MTPETDAGATAARTLPEAQFSLLNFVLKSINQEKPFGTGYN